MRETYSDAQLARAVATGSGAAFGTPIRMMGGRGQLTEAQVNACEAYAEIVEAAQRVLGVRGVRGQSYEQGLGGTPPDPDSPSGQRQAARETLALSRYRSMRRAIEIAPAVSMAIFDWYAVRPSDPKSAIEPIGYEHQSIIRSVAAVLAAHFAREMRGKRKRR